MVDGVFVHGRLDTLIKRYITVQWLKRRANLANRLSTWITLK